MYIDENLIRIITPHKGETIDVSYAISLVKTIAKEYEQKQLLLHNVVKQSELLTCDNCKTNKTETITLCKDCYLKDSEM